MTIYDRPFGRYLEDFVPGDIYRHWPGKTITEYDDHLFCMMTMNHHPLHTNAWFAEHETVQGKNVVVGNLVYSIALGMSVPDVSGSCIANLEVESLLHRSPTFHGDTIYAEDASARRDALEVEGRSRYRDRRDQGLQPARRGGLLLPAQADGVEDGGRTGAAAPLRRRRLGLSSRRSRLIGSGASSADSWSGERTTAATCPGAEHRDPWRILVSEIMLQQTQVDRVVPHYEGFLVAFPTPAACAAAGPAAVVRLWSGLGYNRRALNLHRAAAAMVTDHGGAVPHEDEALQALPGVGPYTARAVRTFAFGDDVAAIDTNGVRVLARGVAGAALTVRQAMQLGDRLVPAGDSWAFNQAMFDLGATVCTAARPGCERCPLRRQCAWRRRGLEGPDPWRLSPTARPQSTFAGSDRQGRGRLLDALRAAGVRRSALAAACGWPADPPRADRVVAALVEEGFAAWSGGKDPVLRLCEGPGGEATTSSAAFVRRP